MGDTMDRHEGLRLMQALYLENTLLKPVACGILLDHYLDKDNKGIIMDSKGEEMVPELLRYASEEFPDSFLIRMRAAFMRRVNAMLKQLIVSQREY